MHIAWRRWQWNRLTGALAFIALLDGIGYPFKKLFERAAIRGIEMHNGIGEFFQ